MKTSLKKLCLLLSQSTQATESSAKSEKNPHLAACIDSEGRLQSSWVHLWINFIILIR